MEELAAIWEDLHYREQRMCWHGNENFSGENVPPVFRKILDVRREFS